jgi:ABC-type glycerol-3-phosphate transport system substrate-binding protein
MPDIMWTTGEKHSRWSEEGIFVELNDMIEADASIDLDDFYSEVIKSTHKNSQDDGIYFMPRDYNKCVLFINKAMFRAAGFTDAEIDGLKDGWNYDKFMETCERLRVAMDNNENAQMGIRENSVPVDAQMDFNASYCSFVYHYGGNFVVGDGVDFFTENNLNAYGEIFELIDKGYIAESAKKSSATFTTLSAAMYIGVRPHLPSMPTSANYDIDFLPLPLDSVGVGCSGYAITDVAKTRISNSTLNTEKKSNQEYAFDFLKFIVSEEGQKVGAEMGSIIPVRKSLANDASWTSYGNASLNHAAFTSAPEKDFNLNLFQDFEANDAVTILDSLSGAMAQVIIGSNYPEGYAATGYQKLKNSIQPYQNAVAKLKAKY